MKSDKSSSESSGSVPNSTSRGSELTAPSVGNASGPEGVSVDKIRDLLFGNQMQDYDRRFSNLEERFQQRFKEIESETSRNLGTFESNAKKQVTRWPANCERKKISGPTPTKNSSACCESRTRPWKSVFGHCLTSSASSIVIWRIA
jgi:Zn-dependent oligopeptidase